ncbi:penicillin acylase family protein [Acidisoma cellulosilytica]|uniref:Penicillin acylase family protein n=1 Tax=Acidisoma cellulosilyticum TaxID=2802395 RepID=A0A964E7A5_9PROT|nr:penicillin acylase family protein [Acidisoma cellulosilyticum]MCB8883803.1 penicillin acylase family protein [Acidisoma cellulosilyticum]
MGMRDTRGLPGGVTETWRDPWGIPHIKAPGRHEAFAALGYVHAEDRLWQMEGLLRRGTGRYAEWVGQPAVAGDMLARRLDTAGASQRDFAALGDDARTMLEAYAGGVNAFIATGRRPVEYGILNAEPQAWLPWHSIAVMRQIGFLMGSVWWKLWRAAALPIVGTDNVGKLRFDDGGNELLCLPPGADTGAFTADLAALKPGIEALLAVAAQDVSGGGSNNWALSPEHTATGRPLLAGDPHRVLEMPNMYAQVHLACDEFDVIGLTVPGVPGFPHFGHNASVAWCVTHAFVDIHDIYVERFGNGGATALYQDQWEPVRQRQETIAVRGGANVLVDVVETRHGPVIAGDPAKGSALALRSMQFAETDRSFDCMIAMMQANTVAGLYEATRDWGLIDHNLVAGDTAGTIGYRVRAKVPKRPRSNGWLPVPGWTGAHEWDGMVPWEAMPAAVNPAGGVIVTANNRVTRDDGEHYLSTDAMPPHRARRIWSRLAALGKANIADMAAIHRDLETIPGQELRDRLRGLGGIDAKATDVHRLILAWDGRMSTESEAASAYIAVRLALTRLVSERSGLSEVTKSPYTRVSPNIIPENQLWWLVPGLLRADDTSILAGASWDDLLRIALSQASERVAEPWGRLHQPQLTHSLSAAFPDHAAALDRLSAEVGGDNDTVFATGCTATVGTRAVYGSLCRYVFDVGAWDNCCWIVFHGASGEPASPWYLNQNAHWAAGEMVPMMYDWEQISVEAVERRELQI